MSEFSLGIFKDYEENDNLPSTGKTWIPDLNPDNFPKDFWELLREPFEDFMTIVFEDGTAQRFKSMQDQNYYLLKKKIPERWFDYAWEFGHVFYRPKTGEIYAP